MRAEANIVNSINWFLLCEHLILAAVSCVPFFERERFSSPFNIFLTQSVRGAKRLQFGCILLFAEAYEKCISARKCVCSLWIAQNFILKEAATARSNNLLKINFQHSLLMLYLFKVSLSFCFIVRCARFAIHRRIGGSVRSFAVYSSVTDRGAFTDLSQEREKDWNCSKSQKQKRGNNKTHRHRGFFVGVCRSIRSAIISMTNPLRTKLICHIARILNRAPVPIQCAWTWRKYCANDRRMYDVGSYVNCEGNE